MELGKRGQHKERVGAKAPALFVFELRGYGRGLSSLKESRNMASGRVEIAVVTKTYQGLEGSRVKAGTRFAVGKAQGGLPLITNARYEALKAGKLVRPLDDADLKAGPRRPLERRRVVLEEGPGASRKPAREIRNKVRARLAGEKQSDAPEGPKQLKGPRNGSQTGPETSASSSPEDQASKTLTSDSLKPRPGRRGSRGAPAPASASPPSTTLTR
jgi:hypothetical protein